MFVALMSQVIWDFSKPSVSHAVKLLSEQGLIVLDVSKVFNFE